MIEELNIFDEYKINLTNTDIRNVEREIKTTLPYDICMNLINNWLDCTKYMKDSNLRLRQTIDHIYKHDISIIFYVISNYITDDDVAQDIINTLIDRHINNLEFERLNPPVVYKKKTTKRKYNSIIPAEDLFSDTFSKEDCKKPKAKKKNKLDNAINPYAGTQATLKFTPNNLKIKI